MTHRRKPARWPLAALLLGLALAPHALAQRIEYPPRIGPREFILDEADLLSPGDEAKIKTVCDKVLTDKKVPIIVVTIDSMAKYGARGWDIRVYGQHLFNTWQIGFEEWNQGMLLLVSKQDRKVAIELGSGWKREKDAECKRIIDEIIIPAFKGGNFSDGIRDAVEALDSVARELKLPTRPRPWWHYALVIGFIALAIFTIVSLIRRRSSGWAWLFWAAVFGLLGYLLYQTLRSRSSGGAGWSGGSFGGGFSGGGGASGSW